MRNLRTKTRFASRKAKTIFIQIKLEEIAILEQLYKDAIEIAEKTLCAEKEYFTRHGVFFNSCNTKNKKTKKND